MRIELTQTQHIDLTEALFEYTHRLEAEAAAFTHIDSPHAWELAKTRVQQAKTAQELADDLMGV